MMWIVGLVALLNGMRRAVTRPMQFEAPNAPGHACSCQRGLWRLATYHSNHPNQSKREH
jgi:hypothetical protein